jgi:hypothetical protein
MAPAARASAPHGTILSKRVGKLLQLKLEFSMQEASSISGVSAKTTKLKNCLLKNRKDKLYIYNKY